MDPAHGIPIVVANQEDRDLSIDEKIHNEKRSMNEKETSSGEVEVVDVDEDGDVIRESGMSAVLPSSATASWMFLPRGTIPTPHCTSCGRTF